MRKTVLIIEDNSEILENISELLELEDYAVLTAGNGKEGLIMALQHQPELILCDIMMPEMNGYDLLMTIKNEALTMNIPFVFVTAKSEGRDVKKGMELGADDYLIKPFGGDDLMRVVNAHAGKTNVQ